MGMARSGRRASSTLLVASLISAMIGAALAAPAGAANGTFDRAWGKDVASGGPGNIGMGFEICVAANGDTCKIGMVGSAGGEMGFPVGIATDGAGNVYVADQSNNR